MSKTDRQQSIIDRAQEMGSTSQTLRGCMRYIIRHHVPATPISGLRYLTLLIDHEGQRGWTRHWSYADYADIRAWERRQQQRTAHPEASRARDDKVYRRNYLRRLRREELRLLDPPARTPDEISHAWDTAVARQERLDAIAHLREIVYGSSVPIPSYTPPAVGYTVSVSVLTARRHGARLNMRGIMARVIPTRRNSYGVHREPETLWSNGRPVHYTRATHDNYVRSFGLVDGSRLLYTLHHTTYDLTLPGGYTWDTDHHQRLRARSVVIADDDYHVDADDLSRPDAVDWIISQIEANRQRRKELRAQELAEQASMADVWVCAADSTRAGNCHAGTSDWVLRHGLDITRHYPAAEIFALGRQNGDFARVRLALKAALLRDQTERKLGYCTI